MIKKTILLCSFLVVITLGAACGLLQTPAPAPLLSATDIPPKVTVMVGLPPTWTPLPTPMPSPTLAPSPTPIPTQDPENYQIGLVMEADRINSPQEGVDHSGWKRVEGKTAEINIPPGFEVLDFAGVFMEMMVGIMKAFAEGFVEVAGEIGEKLGATPQSTPQELDFGELPEIDFIIAMEETTQSAIILASVDREPGTTTEDLLNASLSGSDINFQVLAREQYLDSPLPMERVILDVVDEEHGQGKQIIYVILGDQNGWNLVFTVPENLYEEYLPLYEAVVDSFTPIQ